MTNDDLGDRMKFYEGFETSRRFLPGLPIYARIDGRGFSKFTKGMNRPYDQRMIDAMVGATKTLVEKTHATIGYCQSDEISLVWINERHNWFDGKVMKMSSVLGGLATISFANSILLEFGNLYGMPLLEKMPHFDARVISLPSETEAANMLLWRNLDATKNAISMAASHYYSHKELQNKSGSEKQEMLFQRGVNFNDLPPAFKRGTWVRRMTVEKVLSPSELEKIPVAHRPEPNEKVVRTVIDSFDLPPLNKVSNRIDTLFKGTQPVLFE